MCRVLLGTVVVILSIALFTQGTNIRRHGLGAPRFTKPVQVLSDIKLKCEADGAPPLKYTWLKDGVTLNTSRWLLRIKTAVSSDAGIYTCIVSNKLGNISQSFKLTVVGVEHGEPPKFKNGVNTFTAQVNKVARLRCELVNKTGVTFTWYQKRKVRKNSKRVQKFRLKKGTADFLRIAKVKPNATGEYECVAKNKFGVIRRTVYLTVSGEDRQPPKFKKKEYFFSARVGKVARLKCEVVNKTGVHFTWFHKRKIRRNSKRLRSFRLKKRNNDFLMIAKVKPDDAGMYECVAKNKFGTIRRTLNLTILGSPWFIRPVYAIQYLAWPAASDIKLKCEAGGTAPLKYTWLKDGSPFSSRRHDPNFNTARWFLWMKTLVLSDAGMYTCIVSNKLGNISRSFKLTVVEKIRTKPILSTRFPKNHTVKAGSNVTFQCVELISPILTDYFWLKWHNVPKNHKRLAFKQNHVQGNSSKFVVIDQKQYQSFKSKEGDSVYGGKLMLTNVTKDDAGLYTCLVSNYIGSVARSAFLFVKEGQLSFTNPAYGKMQYLAFPRSSDIKLKCEAEGTPPLTYTWLKDGSPIRNTTRDVLVIKTAVPSDAGLYTCIVSNKQGKISQSFRVHIFAS